jgi:hypothetical protein
MREARMDHHRVPVSDAADAEPVTVEVVAA